jgi:hypothetical protein
MAPDREQALFEHMRIRVGAVLADLFGTVEAVAATYEDAKQFHLRVVFDLMVLGALMHGEHFGGQEEDFLLLAKQARLAASQSNGE